MRSKSSIRAFSLVELLVVVTIVALLAALLFPVLVEARSQAYQRSCASNLRQIGHGFALYTADNDGALPRRSPRAGIPGPFSSPLLPYVPESVHMCSTGPYGYLYRLFLLNDADFPKELWRDLGVKFPETLPEPDPSAVLAVCDAHLLEGFTVKQNVIWLAMTPGGRRGRQLLLRLDGSVDNINARSSVTMSPGVRNGQPVWEIYGTTWLPQNRMLMDLYPGEAGPYGVKVVPGAKS